MVTKERNSNIELFRIIVMLLIVAHHYVLGYGHTLRDNELTAQSWFLYFYGMWGKTGINCFVLITGYFMCKSDITLRKFLKLLLEIEFYTVAVYLIFSMTGYIDFNPARVMRILWPVNNVNSGFVSGFLLYYLFIPFLNIFVRNITRNQHLVMICLSLFVYSFLAKIPEVGGVIISVNYLTWFSIIHVIASYIRLYPMRNEDCTRFWIVATIVSISIAIFSVVAVRLTGMGAYYLVSDSNAPFALSTAFCSFMLFKSMKIPHSKFVNTIAASTFGVLLIHANGHTMRQWLWVDTLQNASIFGTSYLYAHALLSVILVFCICALIDWVRRITIEDSLINFTYSVIERMLNKLKINKNA